MGLSAPKGIPGVGLWEIRSLCWVTRVVCGSPNTMNSGELLLVAHNTCSSGSCESGPTLRSWETAIQGQVL